MNHNDNPILERPYCARLLPEIQSVSSNSTASMLLDTLRVVAALLVLLEHWRHVFFVDLSALPNHSLFQRLMYLVCAAGHQAVIVFFVLSGYLISGSVFRSFHHNGWSWKRYLTRRLVRLWIVLLPALIIGMFWDQLGIRLDLAQSMYSGSNYNHLTPDVRHALSLKDFLGNMIFLQTISVPALGSNTALWSLANEFWYYILFPLVACVAGRVYKRSWQTAACVIIFCGIVSFLTRDILLLFIVWLLGALINAFDQHPTASWFRCFASVAYTFVFFGTVVLERSRLHLPRATGDIILAVATCLFVWLLAGAQAEARHATARKLANSLANCSFTLYASHTPILTFLAAATLRDARWSPSLKTVCSALGALLLVMAYAWLLAAFTECKTDQVRIWIEDRMMRRPRTEDRTEPVIVHVGSIQQSQNAD